MRYVTLTFDCELAWGFADRSTQDSGWEKILDSPKKSRSAYKDLIELLQQYQIPATWAFVAHLFLDQCSTKSHHTNSQIHTVDPYTDRETDPLYYAKDVIESVIESAVDHEIAGHSFSHPEFNELNKEEAATELEAMVDIAERFGTSISSFVFPRGLIDHTDLLREFGIEVYRGYQRAEPQTVKQGVRQIITDSDLFFQAPPVKPVKESDGLIRYPSSRLLKDERWWWLQPHRIKRTIKMMPDESAIHLTLHPHNLVSHPRTRLAFKRILIILRREVNRGILKPVTMREASSLI